MAATADKQMHVFDLTSGSKAGEFKSPLAYQTKSLSIFHDKYVLCYILYSSILYSTLTCHCYCYCYYSKGFAAGSIEGRVAIEYFDEMQNKAAIGTYHMPMFVCLLYAYVRAYYMPMFICLCL